MDNTAEPGYSEEDSTGTMVDVYGPERVESKVDIPMSDKINKTFIVVSY